MKLESTRFEMPSSVGEHRLKLPSIFRLPRITTNSKGAVFVVADVKVGTTEVENTFWVVPAARILTGFYGRCIGSFQKGADLFFVYRKMIERARRGGVQKGAKIKQKSHARNARNGRFTGDPREEG